MAPPLETGALATVPVAFPPVDADGLTAIDIDWVAVALLLSVTLKVTEVAAQAAVGVPEIVPIELSDNPPGKVPELIVHL